MFRVQAVGLAWAWGRSMTSAVGQSVIMIKEVMDCVIEGTGRGLGG
jgi:hypothetical protein